MLKDSFLLTANRLAKSVSQVLVTILFARILTVEEMGIYQQIFLISIMIGSFIPFEMQTTFSYFYNKTDNQQEKSNVVSNTFLVLSGLGTLAFIILLIVFQTELFFEDSHLKSYSLWMGLWCFATITSSYLENLFISTKNAKIFSLVTLAYYFCFLLAITLVIFTYNNLLVTMKVIGILEVFRVALLHIVFHLKQKISFTFNFPLFKKQLNYTLAVGAVTAIEVLTHSTDKMIVSLFFTVKEFAVFSIAAKEVPFMSIVTVAVITAMLPRLGEMYNVQKDPQSALKLWTKTSRTLAVIIFPLFWILLFYHKAFIELLYSKVYLSGALIFIIYLLKFPLRFTVFYTLLLISGRQKLLLINSVITVVLNIVLSFVFLYAFGLIGIAAATVTSAYIGVYLQQRDVCKVFGIKQTELLPYKKILSTFILSGLTTGTVFLTVSIINVHQIVQFLVGSVLAMMACIFVATVRKEIASDFLPKNKLLVRVVRNRNV
ncbi:oligosaccharide flippase family protein [Bacillus timonensis]|nr:oligosaccharide flippase family protein [Bacillus timonensis]